MSDRRSGTEGRAGGEVSLDKAPTRISGMFDEIAGRYDLLNTVLSGGMDRYWRWRAIRTLGLTPQSRLLDVCTGTADVAIAGARRGAGAVVGVDFAGAMLAQGLGKVAARGLQSRVRLVRGDAASLPAADGSVDAVTIAFGIRNVQQPELACRELFRVLRPGGRLAILEFGLPVLPAVRPLYLWYFNHVLPRIGRTVSRHSAAYSYLPQSVEAFPWGEGFAQILRGAGFNKVKSQPLTLGIVYLYSAERP
ncbi:MAG: bifunctional demethylmenaquinone methyltransferase/2-methoxy-6-polyprenyl-1,4-benzoquinol methylase UbiE [Vicinamibacterales bacterium]